MSYFLEFSLHPEQQSINQMLWQKVKISSICGCRNLLISLSNHFIRPNGTHWMAYLVCLPLDTLLLLKLASSLLKLTAKASKLVIGFDWPLEAGLAGMGGLFRLDPTLACFSTAAYPSFYDRSYT